MQCSCYVEQGYLYAFVRRAQVSCADIYPMYGGCMASTNRSTGHSFEHVQGRILSDWTCVAGDFDNNCADGPESLFTSSDEKIWIDV